MIGVYAKVSIRWQTTINPDLGPVLSRFATSSAVLMTEFHAAMGIAAEQLRSELAAATPRGHGPQSGRRLADAWTVTDQGFQWRVSNSEGRKLRYVLKGNDPGGGYIYPVRARFLRFEIDGNVIFARRVRASTPNPFITPILNSWKIGARALFGTTFRRHSRWLAGKGA